MSLLNIDPASVYDGASAALSQARVDTDTALVFVSGQVDWDRDSRTAGTTVGAQAERALGHLRAVLEEAGSSFEHVLQLRVYVRGEVAEHMEALAPIMRRHFGAIRPALTGVGVASLAAPDLLVEIEAVAKVARRA